MENSKILINNKCYYKFYGNYEKPICNNNNSNNT